MTPNLSYHWPTKPDAAERQAAAYLPLHGTRSDLLPRPWPATDGFPRPATVLRSLTAWFGHVGPQPIPTIPACTTRWLAAIPSTHTVMQKGVGWLTEQGSDLWPVVAVSDLLAMWSAVQHGQDTPFTVPGVQEAVELWAIYQDMQTHIHAAIGHVAKNQGILPTPDAATLDALIEAWRDRLGAPPALASTATALSL